MLKSISARPCMMGVSTRSRVLLYQPKMLGLWEEWEKVFPFQPNAKVAKYGPYCVKLEAGKTYNWCSCGESQTQPWIDGQCKCAKHEAGFRPVEILCTVTGHRLMCGCKRCFVRPTFDGTCFVKYVADFPLQGCAAAFLATFAVGSAVTYLFHP